MKGRNTSFGECDPLRVRPEMFRGTDLESFRDFVNFWHVDILGAFC